MISALGTNNASAVPYIVAEPLPDEFLIGWRGRMRVLGGFARSRYVNEMIRIHAKYESIPLREGADFVDLAAAALMRSAEDIWRAHTLAPFLKPLSPRCKLGAKCWTNDTPNIRNRSCFQTGGVYPVLCPECVREDLGFWGFSYWRRTHHLPGVLWCTKHELPLLQVADSNAFDQCPHFLVDAALPILANCDLLIDNPVVSRYVQIAAEILLSAPAIDLDRATVAFNRRACAMNLRVTERRPGVTVSQFVRRTLPKTWLGLVFPRFACSSERYICNIDGACTGNRPRYTTTAFCLIAALLYDDPDEVAHELYGAAIALTPKTVAKRDSMRRTNARKAMSI